VAFQPTANDPQEQQTIDALERSHAPWLPRVVTTPACCREQCRMVEAMVALVLGRHCCASRVSAASW